VTERIYYTDPYAAEFDARVLEVAPGANGRRIAVLDRTAFYPTSGGQPHDTGVLGSARVVDVVDRDDGTIAHVIEGDLDEGSVRGRIDWDRRFEHMQQHTGQHVLSAAFDHLSGARTQSFHLGAASATIDLAREVSPEEIARAAFEANRVVWEDRPVHIRFADAEEAARLPLRKEPARGGLLRLIDIQDFDLSACGGTHVSRTGGIGNIAVASWERFRGGTRVEFLCGVRALRGYDALRVTVTESTGLLSVHAADLPSAIERLQNEGRESKRRIRELQSALARFEGEALMAGAHRHGGIAIVACAMSGWDANGLKTIASGIASQPGFLVVLVTAPDPASIVAARSADVAVDSAALLRAITARFGGKGGGRPELAQGGGLSGNANDIADFARSVAAASAAGT
jgi:alanyl-tRNA synthetase